MIFEFKYIYAVFADVDERDGERYIIARKLKYDRDKSKITEKSIVNNLKYNDVQGLVLDIAHRHKIWPPKAIYLDYESLNKKEISLLEKTIEELDFDRGNGHENIFKTVSSNGPNISSLNLNGFKRSRKGEQK